ncbi:MAG: hypothetical protein Q9160_007432 [Pyrenula sp. 1 TL-2023]
MGTRHLICVYHNNSWVLVQYGQWDGYPPGQGNQILLFLNRDGNIARLKAGMVADASAERPLPIHLATGDASMIEWVYVIDLDTEVLEVYSGWSVHGEVVSSSTTGQERSFEGLGFGLVPELMRTYRLAELPGRFEEFYTREQFCGEEAGSTDDE